MSQDLGVPGDVKNVKVISTIKSAVQKVILANKVAGAFVPQTEEDIKWLLEMGIKFITYNVDSDIIYRTSSNIVKWFEKEI